MEEGIQRRKEGHQVEDGVGEGVSCSAILWRGAGDLVRCFMHCERERDWMDW